jgi:hypothetical protein
LGIETSLDVLIQRAGPAGNQKRTQQRVNQQPEWKTLRVSWTTQVEAGESCERNQEINFWLRKRPIIDHYCVHATCKCWLCVRRRYG